jgi:hypothetical protein
MRAGLTVQVIDGEALVLDRANERIHQLNESGTFILEACDGSRTPAEIVRELVARYEVDEAQATADAADLLERMKALDVLL